MNRRDVLTLLSLAAAGATFNLPRRPEGGEEAIRYPLGLQFFTLTGRTTSMVWDRYSSLMEAAGKIGYDSLELAGLSGFKADPIRKRAEELGLRIRSFHMGFDQMLAFMAPGEDSVLNAQDAVYTPLGVVQLTRVNLPVARDLGCEWGVIAASGHSNFNSVDGIRKLCDAFNKSADLATQAGIKLAYHMHAADFEPVEGRMPFEIMIEETQPTMKYELDVCWALAGGADPAALIRKYPTRIVSFHLKDLSKDKKVATPGDGLVDFAAIHKAARSIDNPIFFVERDGLAGLDPVVEATRSYQYLQRLGWGKAA